MYSSTLAYYKGLCMCWRFQLHHCHHHSPCIPWKNNPFGSSIWHGVEGLQLEGKTGSLPWVLWIPALVTFFLERRISIKRLKCHAREHQFLSKKHHLLTNHKVHMEVFQVFMLQIILLVCFKVFRSIVLKYYSTKVYRSIVCYKVFMLSLWSEYLHPFWSNIKLWVVQVCSLRS